MATPIVRAMARLPTTLDGVSPIRQLLGSCQILEVYLGLKVKDWLFHTHWFATHQGALLSVPEERSDKFPPGFTVTSDQTVRRGSGGRMATPSPDGLTTPVYHGSHPVAELSASPTTPTPVNSGGAAASTICCGKTFSRKHNFQRHIREVHEKRKHVCRKCNRGYSRRDYLRPHVCREPTARRARIY